MPTPEKVEVLQKTTDRIEGVRGIYLADLSGMTVEQATLLRRRCREQQIQVTVIKNTLLKRAFNARGITELDAFLAGPTSLVYSSVNEMAPAKVLSEFKKEFERPQIKAAVVDGKLFTAKEIAVLATLPSREVLLGMVLGTLIAPMTTFLAAIDATLRLPATMAEVLERERSQ